MQLKLWDSPDWHLQKQLSQALPSYFSHDVHIPDFFFKLSNKLIKEQQSYFWAMAHIKPGYPKVH